MCQSLPTIFRLATFHRSYQALRRLPDCSLTRTSRPTTLTPIACKSHTAKFSLDLNEVMIARSAALGYRSVSAYLKGLVRYVALVQGPHSITLPMSNLPDAAQDKIDGPLLTVTKRGVGERGQLLSRLLERVKSVEMIPGEIVRTAQK